MAPKSAQKSASKRRRSSNTASGSDPIRQIAPYFEPEACAARFQKFASSRFTILRYADLDALSTKGFAFPGLFVAQGVKRFLGLKGAYYPDLVREFYANFTWDAEKEIYVSYVQGKYIDLEPDIFAVVADLPNAGGRPYECTNSAWEDYNWVIFYKSCLRHPSLYAECEKPKAGDLTVEDRLILYLITYCLLPKHTSHSTPTLNELALVFAVKNRIIINWQEEILKHMDSRSKSPKALLLPYPVLISRILDYYAVDASDFQQMSLKDSDELDDQVLHAMHIYYNSVTRVWGWRDNKRFDDIEEPQPQEEPLVGDMPSSSSQQPPAPWYFSDYQANMDMRFNDLEQRISTESMNVQARFDDLYARHESFVTHVDSRFDDTAHNTNSGFDQLTTLFRTYMPSFGSSSAPPPPPPSSDD